MQTCNWKSITKYTTIDNEVCEPVVSQTWRSTCTVPYIKSEYV